MSLSRSRYRLTRLLTRSIALGKKYHINILIEDPNAHDRGHAGTPARQRFRLPANRCDGPRFRPVLRGPWVRARPWCSRRAVVNGPRPRWRHGHPQPLIAHPTLERVKGALLAD